MTTHAPTAKPSRRLKSGGKPEVAKDRARRRERRYRLQSDRASRGLCLKCGSSLDSKHKHCANCREKFKRYETKKRNRQKAALIRFGLCRYCKVESSLPGLRACKVCHEKHRQCGIRLREKRRNAGLCPECGKPARIGVCCDDCKARARAQWHNRRRNEQTGK